MRPLTPRILKEIHTYNASFLAERLIVLLGYEAESALERLLEESGAVARVQEMF